MERYYEIIYANFGALLTVVILCAQLT